MQPLPVFKTFTRKVEVEYVDQNLAPSSDPTDFKHIAASACRGMPGMNHVCLDTIFTNR